MASTLLSLLNKHAKKTPDQIAQLLKPQLWVHGKEFNRELRTEWLNKPVRLGYWTRPNEPRFIVMSDSFYTFTWTLMSLRNDLGVYGFCLTENFTEGVLPECPSFLRNSTNW